MPEFIYSMHNVRKKLGDKVVLDNVTLSFYPSAKIGVVGPNGTGKSTLLKLMAGIEKPNNGDAMLAKDATVGILLQEPPLTEGKTVLENVEEGVADVKALQARMDELGVAMGEPDADFDTLMAEMGEVQTELDLGHRLTTRASDGCTALPAARRHGGRALRWGAPSRRVVQAAASAAGLAATR
jgi:ATPase subunit of ABC transporter with duplicated ATPase domains